MEEFIRSNLRKPTLAERKKNGWEYNASYVNEILKDEVLRRLVELKNSLGKSPTVKECRAAGIKDSLVVKFFGNWTEAKKAAGIDYSKRWTDAEIAKGIRRLYKESGEIPTHKAITECPYLCHGDTVIREFGGIAAGNRAAGINTFYKLPSDKLLEILKQVCEKLGREPKTLDLGGEYPSVDMYASRFGSFSKAKELAGVVDNFDYLGSLFKLYEELGRAPTALEVNACYYTKDNKTYARKYGSFNKACELAGIDTSSKTSTPELELLDLLSEFKCIHNDRDTIGKELDIYIPSHSLAIEFNGLYWHSYTRLGKNYHIDKTEKCLAKGVQLIHIFEHEWEFKRDIVESRLMNLLGKSKKVYARKCTIVSLDNCSEFLEKNHIQGNASASVKLGLEYEDNLVAVMTFSKARFSKDCEWELVRYCSLLGTAIVGGASKLFKHFVREYSPQSIVSYCDLRWGLGGLYEKLGFSYSHTSKPNYWYFKGLKVESRMKYQKHKLPQVLEEYCDSYTEWENMEYNGFNKFYDCGNRVFKWYSEI